VFKTSIFDGNFNTIKQAGFDSVMLGWRDDNRNEKPEMARNAGLLIENIHAPTYNSDYMWTDNLNGEDYMECLLSCIEDCKHHIIPTMVTHISYHNTPPPNNTGMRRLKRITEKAEQNNINIAIENTGQVEHIHYIFNTISSVKLGFCFDSGHQNLSPETDCLELFGNRLMAMHLNDNDGKEDMHLLPFDGSIDWNKIARQLKDIQYKGAIALEVSWEKYAPETFYETAFTRVEKLLNMMN
jgi:sugar phosphate isomerase/epimerase